MPAPIAVREQNQHLVHNNANLLDFDFLEANESTVQPKIVGKFLFRSIYHLRSRSAVEIPEREFRAAQLAAYNITN
jgi:hypothetical protein